MAQIRETGGSSPKPVTAKDAGTAEAKPTETKPAEAKSSPESAPTVKRWQARDVKLPEAEGSSNFATAKPAKAGPSLDGSKPVANPSIEGVGSGAASGSQGGNPSIDGIDGAKDAKFEKVEGGVPFVAGPGDKGDIDPNDITQGGLGDCYMLSSLATMAQQHPQAIRDMIKGPDKDGNYTVTLYDKRSFFKPWDPPFHPVEVKVSPDIPMKNGHPAFAQFGDQAGGQTEIWPSLIEKAYAQHYGGNKYHGIEGGWGNEAMEHLTGESSSTAKPKDMSLEQLQQTLKDGKGMTLSSLNDYKLGPIDIPDATESNPLYKNGTLIANHEYYITGVDPKTNEVLIHNPWGYNPEIRIPYDQFKDAFRQVSMNPLK